LNPAAVDFDGCWYVSRIEFPVDKFHARPSNGGACATATVQGQIATNATNTQFVGIIIRRSP